jgi:hypothetical protein
MGQAPALIAMVLMKSAAGFPSIPKASCVKGVKLEPCAAATSAQASSLSSTDRQLKGGRFSVASVLVQGKSAFRGPISPNPGHSTCRVLPRFLDREWGNRPTESLFSTKRNR